MARPMDLAGWQPRFEELTWRHRVPGASLAVLVDGEVTALATGVLHKGTGVEATTDSLFQVGSITKAYTATVVLRLVDQGLATVDAPVAEILPGFRVADPEVSRRVTLRHLLCHTSGINGDFFHDTGRGDDCLARYVQPALAWPRATHWASPSPIATAASSSWVGSSNNSPAWSGTPPWPSSSSLCSG